MSDLYDLVDPEARALLNEVAQDPRSTILRKDRTTQMAQAVAKGEDLWITRKTGLTSAEKQLLEVWRDEAAFLLRQAHLEGFRRAGPSYFRGRFVLSRRNRDESLSESEIAAELHHLYQSAQGEPELRLVIAAAIQDIQAHRLRLMWLATASLSLAPSVAATAYVGDEHLLAGRHSTAGQIFVRLAGAPLTRRELSTVLCSFAVSCAEREQHHEALKATRRAAMNLCTHPSAAVGWLIHSIKLGDTRSAVDAIRHIDETWPTPSPAVAACVEAIKSEDSPRQTMIATGCATIQGVADRASTTSGLILDGLKAFAESPQ